jgi:hypothetical protein
MKCGLENSEPVEDASAYPRFAEVREKYVETAGTEPKASRVAQRGGSGRDQSTTEGAEQESATFGLSFPVLALHQMMHRSHLADALRVHEASTKRE